MSNYLDARDFGLLPGQDATPVLNAAVAAAVSGDWKRIYFPKGAWLFNSQPAKITNGIRLIGDGMSWTQLHRNYNGNFLLWNGEGGMGGGFSDLMLFAPAGTSGGYAAQFASKDDTWSPDFSTVRDSVITGAGTWNYGLVLWGLNRAMGVRDFDAHNVNVFNCNYSLALASKAIGARICGGFYQGGGSSGVCTVDQGSNNVRIEASFAGGGVNVSNSLNVWVNGAKVA